MRQLQRDRHRSHRAAAHRSVDLASGRGPTSIKLKVLHDIIQAVMGWFDYHLWEFAIDKQRYGLPIDTPHPLPDRCQNDSGLRRKVFIAAPKPMTSHFTRCARPSAIDTTYGGQSSDLRKARRVEPRQFVSWTGWRPITGLGS
jgi:Plasmid pRiA4b ORF-3-like protein